MYCTVVVDKHGEKRRRFFLIDCFAAANGLAGFPSVVFMTRSLSIQSTDWTWPASV